jgi:hypothetical protein
VIYGITLVHLELRLAGGTTLKSRQAASDAVLDVASRMLGVRDGHR